MKLQITFKTPDAPLEAIATTTSELTSCLDQEYEDSDDCPKCKLENELWHTVGKFVKNGEAL